MQSGCQGASDPENTSKGEVGDVWVAGECIIIFFPYSDSLP